MTGGAISTTDRRRIHPAVQFISLCARTSLAEEEAHVAKPKLRTATRGENPTGDDEDRHAGSESCEVVRKYTGDRDLEA
jgi:hypothetical protein